MAAAWLSHSFMLNANGNCHAKRESRGIKREIGYWRGAGFETVPHNKMHNAF
jgi:hypothetical protein